VRTPRPVLAAAAAAALVLLPATGAAAHDDLASSAPAADSSVTDDPGVVTLDFTEALLTIGDTTDGFGLEIIDAEGLHHESGCVTVQDAQMSTPVALGGAGGYVVLWQVVSSDGHPTSGQYEFDYEPVSLDGAADGLTDSPVCGDAWAGAPDGTSTPTAAPATAAPESDAPATAAATADDDATSTPGPVGSVPTDLPWPVIVVISLVGLALIATLVVLVLRRQRGGGYGA
jgi:methionine-rich copper-binding protein CopC